MTIGLAVGLSLGIVAIALALLAFFLYRRKRGSGPPSQPVDRSTPIWQADISTYPVQKEKPGPVELTAGGFVGPSHQPEQGAFTRTERRPAGVGVQGLGRQPAPGMSPPPRYQG